MACEIKSVQKNSAADTAGIKSGDLLVSLSGNEIVDVLDYRFYQNEKTLEVGLLRNGKAMKFMVDKDEYEDLGLEFETYLMDSQHSCRNNCIFCFIDQMPPNMRESLYFKDDDSRLSFLFGNYITLTNLSEHEINRIIKMHISPINISVHTTNPELRVKMMRNRFAGKALDIIKKSGLPLAAPSANTSGKPSPTSASHVIHDLDGKIDAVLISSDCEVGVESTVITLATDVPRILRPGAVTYEQLHDLLGTVEIDSAVLKQMQAGEKAASPGMKYKHYAPKADMVIVDGEQDKVISEINIGLEMLGETELEAFL